MKVLCALWFALVAGGCANTPEEFNPPVRGIAEDVEITGDGFVHWNDTRIPVETFMLEMRMASRRAGDDPDKKPRIVMYLTRSPGLSATADLDRIISDLQAAGIKNATIEGPRR